MVPILNPVASRLPAGSGQFTSAEGLSDRACKRIAFGLVLASIAFHLAYLVFDCPLDLSPDEAHYWQWSRHLAWSYYSKGPLVAWLIRASCEVFGPLSESLVGSPMLAVRLPALVCHAALLSGWYVLTVSTLKSHRTALAVVALALTFPIVVAGAVLMTIDPPFLACWCWAVIGVWKGLEARRPPSPTLLPEGRKQEPKNSAICGAAIARPPSPPPFPKGKGEKDEEPTPSSSLKGGEQERSNSRSYGEAGARPTPPAPLPEGKGEQEPTPPAPLPKGKGEQELKNCRIFGELEDSSRAFTPFPLGRGAGGVGSSAGREFGTLGLAWWLLAGVCSALGVLAKYPMVMLPVCVCGYLLFTRRSELKRPGFWLFVLGSIVGLVPIVAWNWRHDWGSFKHVFTQAGGEGGGSIRWLGPFAFAGGQVAFLIGVWFVVWAAAVWSYRRTADPARAFLWWMSVPVWGLFAVASLKASGQLNWPAAAYVTGFVLAVAWARDRLDGAYRKTVARLVSCGVLLGLATSTLVHFPALMRPALAAVAGPVTPQDPTPIRKFDPTARLRGWRTLAAEVDAIRARVRSETGAEPVVAASGWNLPGQLGAYCTGHPETYSLGPALGDRHSQYDIWRPNPVADAQAFRGRAFVVVGGWPPAEHRVFERMEPPLVVTYREEGAPVAMWWIWVGYGYNGFREPLPPRGW